MEPFYEPTCAQCGRPTIDHARRECEVEESVRQSDWRHGTFSEREKYRSALLGAVSALSTALESDARMSGDELLGVRALVSGADAASRILAPVVAREVV